MLLYTVAPGFTGKLHKNVYDTLETHLIIHYKLSSKSKSFSYKLITKLYFPSLLTLHVVNSRVVLQLCFSAITLGPLVVSDDEVSSPGLSSVPWLVYMLAGASPFLVFLINELVKQQEIK